MYREVKKKGRGEGDEEEAGNRQRQIRREEIEERGGQRKKSHTE